MKKTYVEYASAEQLEVYRFGRADGVEVFALYTGVDALEGGWLLESSGDPCCQNSLEEAGATRLIESVEAIIASTSTPWGPMNSADEAYISDTLESWGLA